MTLFYFLDYKVLFIVFIILKQLTINRKFIKKLVTSLILNLCKLISLGGIKKLKIWMLMSNEPHYRVFYNELSFLNQRKKTKTQLYYLPASAILWKAKCEFTSQNCAFVQNLNWIFLMHTELLEEVLDSTCTRQLN